MRSDRLKLNRSDTFLLVVDVQEKLHPVMHEPERKQLEANLVRLGEATRLLDVPVVITEQYPKGLGHTIPAVKQAFANAQPHAKLCFDASADAGADQAIAALGRPKAVVAGMEAHICVFQTVRSLLDRGFTVHVLKDAVASRTRDNYETGLALAREAGAVLTSTETVLFDLLGAAGTDAFKAISKLVR